MIIDFYVILYINYKQCLVIIDFYVIRYIYLQSFAVMKFNILLLHFYELLFSSVCLVVHLFVYLFICNSEIPLLSDCSFFMTCNSAVFRE